MWYNRIRIKLASLHNSEVRRIMQTDKDYSDDISRWVKIMKRRERYEREREAELRRRNNVLTCGSDCDWGLSYAAYMSWKQSEETKKSCQALYEALEDLRLIDPAGHRLVVEYYLEEGVTLTEIGRKHGISRQACRKRINKCLDMLQTLVKLHGLGK